MSILNNILDEVDVTIVLSSLDLIIGLCQGQ